MTIELDSAEARVLGALVEKHLTTPQQYPLSLASMLTACNQTTNRDPVVTYDEETVMAAVDGLKQKKLARSVLPSHGRSVVRFRHVLDESLGLDTPECALLAVLMLRGPQTPGELRIRTDRMTSFDSLGELESELERLAAREEPLVANVGRRPGQKEERWACTIVTNTAGWRLGDDSSWGADRSEPYEGRAGSPSGTPSLSPLDSLKSDLADLRGEVAGLRAELADLRASLGD
ncbi:MAG TPA: YceH family protein [Acidimicrobiales bacterium]|jgi:hypothetical protein